MIYPATNKCAYLIFLTLVKHKLERKINNSIIVFNQLPQMCQTLNCILTFVKEKRLVSYYSKHSKFLTILTFKDNVYVDSIVVGVTPACCLSKEECWLVEGNCHFWRKTPPAGGFLGWLWAV